MKKIVLVGISWLAFQSLEAQIAAKHSLTFGLGYSSHGTGDMKGISFFSEYCKLLGKRTDWSLNATSTIHGGAAKVILIHPDGTSSDASFRYNHGGLQIGPKAGYRILQAGHHQVKIQAGAFARYQNSSLPDVYSYHIDQNSETVNFDFLHEEKQNTFSCGYSVDLSYNFITSKKLILGFKAGFQNDTRGDVITHLTLLAGRSFSKLL